mgnify:CR=1
MRVKQFFNYCRKYFQKNRSLSSQSGIIVNLATLFHCEYRLRNADLSLHHRNQQNMFNL